MNNQKENNKPSQTVSFVTLKGSRIINHPPHAHNPTLGNTPSSSRIDRTPPYKTEGQQTNLLPIFITHYPLPRPEPTRTDPTRPEPTRTMMSGGHREGGVSVQRLRPRTCITFRFVGVVAAPACTPRPSRSVAERAQARHKFSGREGEAAEAHLQDFAWTVMVMNGS